MSSKPPSTLLKTFTAQTDQLDQECNQMEEIKKTYYQEFTTRQPPIPHDILKTDPHLQCCQLVKKSLKQAEQKLVRVEQQKRKVEQQLNKKQDQVRLKALILARVEGMHHSLSEKSLVLKDQINRLTANLRLTSSRLKNALAAYDTIRSIHKSAASHEREAMTKMIRHYEQQLYPQESPPEDQLNVQRLVKLSEEQQADIEGLLCKMIQREEQAISTKTAWEETLRLLREDAVFEQELCTKIQESLKASASIDRDLYDTSCHLIRQNSLLRLRNQELERQAARTNLVQSNISKYEQELQHILHSLQQSTIREVDRIEQLTENTPTQNILHQGLRSHQLKENSEQNLIKSLQKELEQRDRVMRQLEHQLKASQQKVDVLKERLYLRSQLQSEILLPSSKPSLSQTLPNNLSHNTLIDQLLLTSEILVRRDKLLRVELAKQLRKSIEGIHRTKLLFQADKYNLNFGKYLPGQPAILLLIAIDSQRLIAAFGFFNDASPLRPAFLGVCEGEKWEWMQQRKQEFLNLKAVRFCENSLIFGNNELIVHNNSSEYEAVLNTKIFGPTFFQNGRKIAFLKEPAFHYQQLQIHAIE